MARGDQQVPDDDSRAGASLASGTSDNVEARNNLLLAVADAQPQPRVWAREAQLPPNPNNQSTDIPTVDGYTIRIDPRKNFIDIYGPNNERMGRQRLDPNQPLRLGNKEVFVNPNGYIDAPTTTGFERHYPNARENYVKAADGKTFNLAERRYPDGSYERYSNNGKLAETKLDGYLTKFDANGRKTEVSTPQGDKYSFQYRADGKVDTYELTRNGADGKPQTLEKATRGPDGNLRIERRQADGTMKVDERLKDRADVVLRSDLKMDYLDKDGYGLPDATGRSFKRDDRTVMAPSVGPNGEVVPRPVNPIRSVRMADGRQIDYEYSSDKARAQGLQGGQDGLSSYTIRDRSGKVIEFAQRIPDIPGENPVQGWMEYKAKPGQSLPQDKIDLVKRLMAPADQSKLTTQQGAEQVRAEMLRNRQELFRTTPMVENMPTQKGQETVSVGVDQITGKQFNVYGNGDTLVRSDRTTIVSRNQQGWARVEGHQSRRDNSYIDINYDSSGRIPSEIIVTQANGQSVRMAPDANNPNSWQEFKKSVAADGKEVWSPTGRSFPMKVELVTAQYGAAIQGKPLAEGTVIISQGDKHRIITPTADEVAGTQAELNLQRFVNQNAGQQRRPDWLPPGQQQRERTQTPPVRPDRRQQGQQPPRVRY